MLALLMARFAAEAERLAAVLRELDGGKVYHFRTQPTYWFLLAKRYGWGWGLPLFWHGWVVLAALLPPCRQPASFFVFPPNEKPGALFAYFAALTGILDI